MDWGSNIDETFKRALKRANAGQRAVLLQMAAVLGQLKAASRDQNVPLMLSLAAKSKRLRLKFIKMGYSGD